MHAPDAWKFSAVGITSGCSQEILGNSALAEKIADTRAIVEVKVLEEFFQVLAADPARAFYGPGHVVAAVEQGAVGKLLMADSLYRCGPSLSLSVSL